MAQIMRLQNSDDPRLRHYANLRSDAYRPLDAESFIVEGRWCLQRLLASRYEVMSVLVQRGKEDEVAPWLPEVTPLYSLPSEQIRQLVGFNFHRGMLACGKRPPLEPIDQLRLRRTTAGTSVAALAVLGVNQHENLGSMMRTAAAFGIEHLLIGPKTADPLARRTIRVSMAAVFQQRLYQLDRPRAQLDALRRTRNIRILVTTLDPDATPLSEWVADDRHSIVVVGNEAEGIDRSVQEIATDRVTIPMRLGIDSLNVSIAAAIVMYQLLYRHPHPAQPDENRMQYPG